MLINPSSLPPIKTPEGWLVIYHGVKQSCGGCIYRLGLALFDLNKPECLIKRGTEWIFAPEEPYEKQGDIGDVIFHADILFSQMAMLLIFIMVQQIHVLP